MQLAIGGEFEAIGIIERELLRRYGLRDVDYVIDVGCGSGRLAKPLAEVHRGRYLGTDVVPELIEHARLIAARPDWRFTITTGLAIPEADAQADMVCAFSVFTHLLHEHTYTYLRDARRVLKPGGSIVFSFLEFGVRSHWTVFQGMLENAGNEHLNMFISRDAIAAWAEHLELDVVAILDGDRDQVTLPTPITLEDGRVLSDGASLGQSVCVLKKPAGQATQ